jgi:transcriptional regulator GlxA family with amidase domain
LLRALRKAAADIGPVTSIVNGTYCLGRRQMVRKDALIQPLLSEKVPPR